MTNTMAYRKWNVAFFGIFLILFIIPCVKFELAGIMTGTTRILLGAMILVLAYGLIRSLVRLNLRWKPRSVELVRTDILEAE